MLNNKLEFSLKLATPLQKLELSSLTIMQSLDVMKKKDVKLPDPENDAFGQLPQDMQLLIFRYLTARQLCRVAGVSKYWNALSALNTLWKSLSTNLPSFSCESYKESYKNHNLAMLDLTRPLVPTKYLQPILPEEFLPTLPFLLAPRFDFKEPNPMQSGDTTIYAPDLHPFDDDFDPNTQAVKLLP